MIPAALKPEYQTYPEIIHPDSLFSDMSEQEIINWASEEEDLEEVIETIKSYNTIAAFRVAGILRGLV